MKKILVGKNDELSLIAEKIITVEDRDIVLNIPRFSRLAHSAINFELLKREAEASGKTLVVESVDEKIVLLAQHVGLEAYNPFFQAANRSRPVSDILPPSLHAADEPPRRSVRSRGRDETQKEKEQTDAYAPLPEAHVMYERKPRRIARLIVALVGVAVIGGAAYYAGAVILPRADIRIVSKKFPWEYHNAVRADKAVAVFDAERLVIPGTLLIDKKNTQQSFPASGEKYVERKATGAIAIYNTFSSESQQLVKTTRFEAPGGKIFRIDKDVVVPGAKIVDGKVVPASITAPVTADKAGAEYNISPVERFTIPGFKGSPKYETFYGASDASMQGGFVGKQAYPTDADISAAKKKVSELLEEALNTSLPNKLPQEFKFLDGATRTRIVKHTVIPEVDADGRFSVIGEAEISTFGFRENDVLALLTARARKEGLDANVVLKDYTIGYTPATLSEQNTTLAITLDFQGVFVLPVDTDAVRQAAAGKYEKDLQAFIFSIPGVESAQVNFRPKWRGKITTNPEHIDVTVE